MSEKTYELLVQILAAQVLTMDSLMAIEARLGMSPARELQGSGPEPQPTEHHP